jgi:uncharacterized damage-inducible protein DinB
VLTIRFSHRWATALVLNPPLTFNHNLTLNRAACYTATDVLGRLETTYRVKSEIESERQRGTQVFRSVDAKRKLLDRKRVEFLNRLAQLPPAKLMESPGPHRWSLLQVAQHLVLGERAVLRQLPAPSELFAHKRTFANRASYLMVLVVLRLGIRVKVPSQQMEPDGKTTLEEIRQDWDESQEWLKRFIRDADAATLRRPYFRHPVTGPLTIAQALTLALIHFDSHLRRIQKSIRNDLS